MEEEEQELLLAKKEGGRSRARGGGSKNSQSAVVSQSVSQASDGGSPPSRCGVWRERGCDVGKGERGVCKKMQGMDHRAEGGGGRPPDSSIEGDRRAPPAPIPRRAHREAGRQAVTTVLLACLSAGLTARGHRPQQQTARHDSLSWPDRPRKSSRGSAKPHNTTTTTRLAAA